MTTPFPLVERAVRELIETKRPDLVDKVDADLTYDPASGEPYVFIALIPGAGQTDEVEGEWSLDIEVFAPHYGTAMELALALEAELVGPKHRTSSMILDGCTQNEAPAERPWDDDAAYRVGAVYTFTARRSG